MGYVSHESDSTMRNRGIVRRLSRILPHRITYIIMWRISYVHGTAVLIALTPITNNCSSSLIPQSVKLQVKMVAELLKIAASSSE